MIAIEARLEMRCPELTELLYFDGHRNILHKRANFFHGK